MKTLNLNSYYYIRLNKFTSFEIKVVDIAKNGDFLGLTNYGHTYRFKQSDSCKAAPSCKKDWSN